MKMNFVYVLWQATEPEKAKCRQHKESNNVEAAEQAD